MKDAVRRDEFANEVAREISLEEDPVGLWAIVSKLKRTGFEGEALRAEFLATVRHMVERGDLVVGEMNEQGLVVPWRSDVETCVRRLADEWPLIEKTRAYYWLELASRASVDAYRE